MELRQLQYFVAVVRHGGFTAAADALWLTQSALSQQVRKLEAEVGVALLRRGSRGVVPTAAGEALLPRAEAMLAQAAAARAELDEHAGATRGRVRVAATPGDAVTLPAALVDFHRAHPALQLALRHGPAEEVAGLVAAGTADVGVTALAGPPPAGARLVEELTRPLRLIVAAGDPLAGAGPVALEQVRDRPFILGEPGSALRELVVAACQEAGFSPVPLLEIADPTAVRHLAAAGLGVSVVPAAWLALDGPEVSGLALARPLELRVALLVPAAGPSPAGGLLLAHLGADG